MYTRGFIIEGKFYGQVEYASGHALELSNVYICRVCGSDYARAWCMKGKSVQPWLARQGLCKRCKPDEPWVVKFPGSIWHDHDPIWQGLVPQAVVERELMLLLDYFQAENERNENV